MNPLLRRALGVLLAWGFLCICLAVSEDHDTEGLSSTSFMDFTTMAHLKSLDSSEQTNIEFFEPDFVPSALQVSPSSGFSSEEHEDAKVLQSQYLWEEGGDSNDSSLYGPASDYNLPLGKTLPPQNGTQVKHSQDVSIHHQTSASIDPDSEAPSTSALEEEEGLLPINQSKGTSQSRQTPKVTFSETPGQDSLYSILFSTPTSRIGPAAEVATNKQEKESTLEPSSSGYDLGSSMGPSLLPLSPILSATPMGPQLVSELPLKITSEISVPTIQIGGELDLTTITAVEDGRTEGKATTHEEIPKPAEAEVGQDDDVEATVAIKATEITEVELRGEDLRGSHEDKPQVTEPVFQTPNSPLNPSSLVHFGDQTSEQAPTSTLIQNIQNTKLPIITTAAAEPSFIPQNRDVHLDVLASGVSWSLTQVICKDWSNLAGKNYIILNMSDNIDCEEFRVERGLQLLALMKDAFSRYNSGLQGQWLIFLSKPNENDKHLLMSLAREHEDVSTHDVLLALGEMRKNLAEIGIQNYTTTSSCQSLPSQTHSDYGKLFVVLVIIGSICVIIIITGLIYNCWQRRLPKMKNASHGEELRFVENGCHDNPTLDVANDSRSEMQEKKPSVNGGGTINGPESWDVLINKQASEEGEVFEEDTHL